MFTGQIERIGNLVAVRRAGEGLYLEVGVETPFDGLVPGESISVDGACLTVVEPGATRFCADVSPETAAATTLKYKQAGTRVNLERAMRLSDRLGGHMVTGHVDCVGRVVQVVRRSDFREMSVEVPRELLRFIVHKGSVAVDGVSLTVASLSGNVFRTALIPATLSATTLDARREGDKVNIETDIIGRYVARLVESR